ncbi:helix-turn-helix domain-containing protein [Arthrobacter sp. ISL-48]|uniref:helix-turn-helix transcriptional regulator n=1 Tax=Arthrobacter sp. ISL-48 TaxID=2819110 RepID=UPI001BE75456|nr:helix-turn-helix transcriptional regulator [Arthrobacter sp. ISL-48]MBT2532250.1 helix-turn-helix domain-containing protein [Arthrobacter sp. ISL-48]
MRTDHPSSNHVRLGNFLRTRREQTRPEDIGLPASTRRRTPGLRREEVAVLANVGVSWYTWLEQGRAIGASEEILDAIANALRLSPEDRTYVRRLASGRRSQEKSATLPAVQPPVADDGRLELLQQLVDAMANPSYISDPFWTVVAMNSAAASTFDTRIGASCLQRFFTDQKLARAHVHQEMMARSMVAQFRAQSAKFPDDPTFEIMARGLREVSEAFRELWQRQVVGDSYHVDVVYDHTTLGRLSFDPVVLVVPQFPRLRLFTYLPKSGTGTQAALLGLNRNAVVQHNSAVQDVGYLGGLG